MDIPEDINNWIYKIFSNAGNVHSLLNKLECKERNRVMRCCLMLSDQDTDALSEWIKKANIDYRNIIWYAEYDNRNVRKFNYNYPIQSQIEYSYKE